MQPLKPTSTQSAHIIRVLWEALQVVQLHHNIYNIHTAHCTHIQHVHRPIANVKAHNTMRSTAKPAITIGLSFSVTNGGVMADRLPSSFY